jgi:hypothetical protein
MQWSFQYHIGIGIEYNDIDFECNTNDITFVKQYAMKFPIPYCIEYNEIDFAPILHF